MAPRTDIEWLRTAVTDFCIFIEDRPLDIKDLVVNTIIFLQGWDVYATEFDLQKFVWVFKGYYPWLLNSVKYRFHKYGPFCDEMSGEYKSLFAERPWIESSFRTDVAIGGL